MELTAFDRNSKLGNYFRDYQFEFIKNWSISAQELVILYYGVGSGKTLIAVNCAEQYISLNNNSVVYFLTPASLVLNTIEECYKHGINPDAKYPDGSPKFYFVSYQQLLRSLFDFKDNSLLCLTYNILVYRPAPRPILGPLKGVCSGTFVFARKTFVFARSNVYLPAQMFICPQLHFCTIHHQNEPFVIQFMHK